MRMNVSQLLKETIGSTRNYKMKEIINLAGDDADSLVQGEIKLTRTNRGILVRGKISADVEVTCSRCLSPFSCHLNLKIVEEYFPVVDVLGGSPVPLPDEPGCFAIDEHHILDMTEAVRQYAIMATPMKPLCITDCAGLCPDCGSNLNKTPYSCPPREADPRWSKLMELSIAGKTPADK